MLDDKIDNTIVDNQFSNSNYVKSNYSSIPSNNESLSHHHILDTKVVKYTSENQIKYVTFTIDVKRIEERNRIREINKEFEKL